jgi:general nucleoside transport system permease protein
VTAILPILTSTVAAATPLIYAGLGELVVERSGVLNLGVEGMMLVGALAGFAVGATSGSLTLGYLAAIGAGVLLSLLFAFLTLTLQTNQVATGLALTLFGIGLSAFAGRHFAGLSIQGLRPLPLVHVDVLVFGSIALYLGVDWFLRRTRAGLELRAIGESPAVAHSLGQPVMRVRYLSVMFGGATSGMAGAYMSTALTPMWVENMSAGRGWIALALVVFATWKPLRVLLGAYLFGAVSILQLYAQGFGLSIPSEFLSMLPYLATIVVLVIICRDPKTIRLNQPASLGKSFHAGA